MSSINHESNKNLKQVESEDETIKAEMYVIRCHIECPDIMGLQGFLLEYLLKTLGLKIGVTEKKKEKVTMYSKINSNYMTVRNKSENKFNIIQT